MITASESIRKLLLAHLKGDDTSFHESVLEYIEEERRKNHHVLARELGRLLENRNGNAITRNGALKLLGITSGDLPQDKERGVMLVEVSDPSRGLDDLVLSRGVRDGLDRVVQENRGSDLLRSFGLRPAGKILFCGPPGCGKTVAAEALAKELYLPLVLVRFDAVVSSYLGETAANLRKVFEFARSRPMVLFFDEFDAIGKHRTAEEEHGELKRVVNSFLQLLDGFKGEALTIAATNHQGLLDPALWRRFDEIVMFERPNESDILDLLTRNLRQIGIDISISLEDVSKELTGMSHADVERLALDAVKQTVLENKRCVTSGALRKSIQRQKARIDVTELSIGTAVQISKRTPGRRKGAM